jgi:hypothetical protein
VLREDLHHPAVGTKVLVGGKALGLPLAVRRFEDAGEPVGGGLVGADEAEVVGIVGDHVTEEPAQHPRRLRPVGAGRRHVDAVGAEIGQQQLAE